MKKLLLILLVCLLPMAALAHTGTSRAEVISACLEALGEEWMVCEGEDGQPLFSNGGSCAVAFVTDGARMSLAWFDRVDGHWHDGWRTAEPLFGVDGLVPVHLELYEEDGALFLFCSLQWGEKLLWVTAQEDYYGRGSSLWFVTEHSVLAPAEDEGWHMEDRWLYTNAPYGAPPLLEYFSPVAQAQEPVIIEGSTLVRYPESRTDAYYAVPEGVEVIGENAFSGNDALIRVTLPESVRIIEDEAFAYCQNLRIVDMPATLESLGERAFDCSYVQQLTIPEGLTELPAGAFAAADLQGTVIIPEGIVDIGAECFVFNDDITDMYLPASLETIDGESAAEGWGFAYIYDFNHIDYGQVHMTVHAPAGTEAAKFAMNSGYPYVIEDARSGTDLPAVTGWVQALLDESLPGAVVCENEFGFPCVTYSADTVFAFAMRETDGWYDEWFLCCFDRAGDTLALRFVNDALYGKEWPQFWPERMIPLDMQLYRSCFSLVLQSGEQTVIALSFARPDFSLTGVSTCIWYEPGDGTPDFWLPVLDLSVPDGPTLSGFSTVSWPSEDE